MFPLTPVQALIMGIVQGLTEFLPVSSTAHLVLFPWLLGWPDPGQTFDVALHAGTLLAVVIYFWSDWVDMLARNHRQLGLVILACVPAGVMGILFEKKFERLSMPEEFHLAPLLIACFLAFAGLLLYWVDQRSIKRHGVDRMGARDAFLIGCGQAIALLPGVSRSGATIGTGLFLGLSREAAARFSFLVSAPVIFGAVLLKAYHLTKTGIPPGEGTPMLIGIIASAVSGYLAVRFLMNWVRTRPYTGFVVYRVILAVAILGFWLIRR